MSLTLQAKDVEQHGLQHVSRTTFIAVTLVTKQMTLKDKITIINSAAAAGTVYLPPLAETVGEVFTVIAATGNTQTVTVKPFEGGVGVADSTLWLDGTTPATSAALTGANSWVCVKNVGLGWIVLSYNLDAA
jgi:hypothetical protein